MMERTDRHFRMMLRGITRRTLLYTEMVHTHAIIHGDRERFLGHDPVERPLALQVGGDDPAAVAECATIAEEWGFDEINLNVGCPSDRVQAGRFGACLMGDPNHVATLVRAMRAATSIPVTVKHRIGIDHLDRYEDMKNFVDIVAEAGSARFSVHARKAWLSGLSPHQNRTVPPLRYDDVYRLKEERPDLRIELNGGVKSADEAASHLERVDAVMIGRAAFDDPACFADVDARFYGEAPRPLRLREVLERYVEYAREGLNRTDRYPASLPTLTRALTGLVAGRRGSRQWRRRLGEAAQSRAATPATRIEALEGAVADLDDFPLGSFS